MAGRDLFLHADCGGGSPKAQQFRNELLQQTLPASMAAVSPASLEGLPPSGARIMQQAADLPALVLAGYDTHYSDRFYHSRFDIESRVNSDDLCAAASTVATSLATLLGDNRPVDADCSLTTELFLGLAGNRSSNISHPYSTTQYSGIYRPHAFQSKPSYIAHMVANITGEHGETVCKYNSDCGRANVNMCAFGKCVNATTYFMDVLSLGVSYNYDKRKWDIVNKSIEIWTESLWGFDLRTTVFLEDSLAVEIGMLMFGVAVCGLTAAAILFGDRWYKKTFKLT
mmetsp:Transcript_2917/g.7556  ORF Transcript_2917/g.7556 Transcript_2917/m.7556 type:complete len:284 (+) Transcript_2917:321-1172(+)